jgi:hypothetical protein
MINLLDIFNMFKKSQSNDLVIPYRPGIIPKKIITNKMEWTDLKPINTSTIKSVDFPENKFYPIEYPKKQIVLHHTVSNPKSVQGDIDHWLSLKDRIATCIIIGGDGIVHQCFSSKYWAHHLGVKSTYLRSQGFIDWSTRNVELNRGSIAVEIDSWGGLILGDGKPCQFGLKSNGKPNIINTETGKFYNAYGTVVSCDVQEYAQPFRGYKYYEKYNKEQIKSLGELLLLWHIKYAIPLDYHEDMWDINKKALNGEPGIWTHINYREDKSDCHPDPDLISMLKTLKSLI